MTYSKFLYFLLLGSICIFLNSCGGDDAPTPPPAISAPTVAGLFQPEGQLTVNFTVTGTFKEGNVFTAQLSDGSGSFTNPLAIGTLTSLTTGTISATLPASVANGNAYRIRVVASTPSTISPDNGTNLTIAKPTISITSFATSPVANQTYIAGRSVNLVIATTGTYAADNQFSIELSNAAGSFSTVFSGITGTTLANKVISLPTTITPGNDYRFKVSSTKPAVSSEFSAQFTVVNLALAAPTFSSNSNQVAGGIMHISVTPSNGPWFTDNQITLQLSDANGNFDSPTSLATLATELNVLTNFTSVALPVNIPAGTGYKLRTVTTNPVVTSATTSAFPIGALPTLTITEASPVFTRMYSAQANATGLHTYYVFNVQGTGSFNPNTTFVFEVAGPGESFGTPSTLSYGSLSAATLSANGSVSAFVGLRNAPTGSVKFRVRANGHTVASNEKTYTVYPTAVTDLIASVDNVNYNFNTAPTISTNASTASGANNQTISLAGDAVYNLNGATKIRAYVGISLTNEVVTTGARTVSITMQLLNSTGQLVAAYSNASVSTTITGNATNGYSGTIGNITLTKFGTGTGPATLSVQNGSFTFKME